jgi:glutathione S-transferase
MSDIILHHYPLSPFSEKIRLALGLKDLSYRSVTIPVWMPKPELMPLTGGYRRTPVLQIGADIYCDTLLILQVIERLQPEPSLYPDGTEGLAAALGWWAEKFTFMPAICLTASLIGEHFPAALIEERKPFFGIDLSKEAMLKEQALNRQRLQAHLHWLGQMLQDGRPFLLGDAAGAADLAAYHPLWFARKNAGAAADALLPLAPLRAWYDRVGAIGHGHPSEIPAAEALGVARAADPAPAGLPNDCSDPSGCQPGDWVTVTPDDTGRDPVTGLLVACSPREVVISREDPAIGQVHLHFPRAGFDVVPAP